MVHVLAYSLRRGRDRLADLVFPPYCAHCVERLCGEDGVLVCDGCRRTLVPELGTVCRRCAATVSAIGVDAEDCASCRPLGLLFERTVVLGRYQDSLREAVLRLKHPGTEALATALTNLFSARRGDEIRSLHVDVVVPIPMHWWRRLRRGINHAELLAETLGRRLELLVARRALARRRNTQPQAGLSPRERMLNVRGAFRVRHANSIAGRRVLLVDDIVTTGATCNEAAKMLFRSGATAVAVAAIARAAGAS